MNHREYWRWNQLTPYDQLVTIQNSLLGWIDNMLDGTSDVETAARHVVRNAAEINDLAPYLKQGHW